MTQSKAQGAIAALVIAAFAAPAVAQTMNPWNMQPKHVSPTYGNGGLAQPVAPTYGGGLTKPVAPGYGNGGLTQPVAPAQQFAPARQFTPAQQFAPTQPAAPTPVQPQRNYAPQDLDDKLAASVNNMAPAATAAAQSMGSTMPMMQQAIPGTTMMPGTAMMPGVPMTSGMTPMTTMPGYTMPGYGMVSPLNMGGYPANGAYTTPMSGVWGSSDGNSQGVNSWPFGSFSPFGFW